MRKNKVKAVDGPHSKESEMMVLGCMLNKLQSLIRAAEDLEAENFYFNEHKTIFQLLKEFYKNDKPADIHLVAEKLKQINKLNEIGGVGYLTTLAQHAGISAYIEEYIELLKNKSKARKAIIMASDFIRDVKENPDIAISAIEQHRQNLVKLEKRFSPNDKASISDILSGKKSRLGEESFIEKLKTRKTYFAEHGKPFINGIPLGYVDFDDKATVLSPTNLIVLAGRPAMGKTAFALNISANVCFNQNKPVAFISLEMGSDQLIERRLSIKSRVSGEKISRGTLSDEEFEKIIEAEKEIRQAPFFIHDHGISTVSHVVSRARRLKDEEDIQLLTIDYLQLLNADRAKDSRQYEIAEVSRTLKQAAMELQIPIVTIAQLSRKVEDRGDKKPLMSDLRDSGQIEQDADAVIMLYRRDYYEPSSLGEGKIEVLLKKNRHGPELEESLAFQKDCGAFFDLPKEKTSDQIKNCGNFRVY